MWQRKGDRPCAMAHCARATVPANDAIFHERNPSGKRMRSASCSAWHTSAVGKASVSPSFAATLPSASASRMRRSIEGVALAWDIADTSCVWSLAIGTDS